MNPHITLAPCRVEHYPALTAYQLTGEQAEFSRPPSDWLSGNIPFGAAPLAVTILRDDAYSTNPHAVLLRSMSLNPRHQGNGYARTALVPATLDAFIRAHFPACDEIVLGVHHANRAAVRLYQRVGFADTGRTYDGLKGLQFIYHRVLVREG